MMGKDFDDLATVKSEEKKDFTNVPVVIDAQGMSHKGKIKPFDLQIHKGEVVGLTGLLGSGRSELARVIYGADKTRQVSCLSTEKRQRSMRRLMR